MHRNEALIPKGYQMDTIQGVSYLHKIKTQASGLNLDLLFDNDWLTLHYLVY